MKADSEKIQQWLTTVSTQLPAFDVILKSASTQTLLIGAGVFELYQELQWIPPFKRQTGDLDLSVGIVSGENDYNPLRDALLKNGYQKDAGHAYRYHTPKKIPGAITYVDLLAYPANTSIKPSVANRIMGAGSDFSFKGFTFAALETFKITSRVHFVNPFGMWSLKQASYLDDPVRRIKDLADIIELGSGLVETGIHFELGPLWERLKSEAEAISTRQMLTDIARGESPQWDIENARQELLGRGFTAEEVDDTLSRRLSDLVEMLKHDGVDGINNQGRNQFTVR